jgi:hypothetical protein
MPLSADNPSVLCTNMLPELRSQHNKSIFIFRSCEMPIFVRLHVSSNSQSSSGQKVCVSYCAFLHKKIFLKSLKSWINTYTTMSQFYQPLLSQTTYIQSPFCRRCFDSVPVVYNSRSVVLGCRVSMAQRLGWCGTVSCEDFKDFSRKHFIIQNVQQLKVYIGLPDDDRVSVETCSLRKKWTFHNSVRKLWKVRCA